jgi:hypothetical protein
LERDLDFFGVIGLQVQLPIKVYLQDDLSSSFDARFSEMWEMAGCTAQTFRNEVGILAEKRVDKIQGSMQNGLNDRIFEQKGFE